MNTNLNTSALCYGLFQNDTIIGFCSVIHFPHPIVKNMKRVHRLVVLPDYQGIGLGTKFESFIAGLFKGKGFQFFTTTSAKNSIMAKANSKDWKCTRHNIVSGGSRTANEAIRKTHRKVKTASFEYIGKPIYAE